MTPSGHKAFLVSNVNDIELLLMHNRTYAAEYVHPSLVLRRLNRKDQKKFRQMSNKSSATPGATITTNSHP